MTRGSFSDLGAKTANVGSPALITLTVKILSSVIAFPLRDKDTPDPVASSLFFGVKLRLGTGPE